jgi:hypothetical protein
VTSRGGFVLLRRRHASEKLSNLCVYELFIGSNTSRHYHLLTFADGIDCLFLLFVVNLSINRGNNIRNIQVQTATSTASGPSIAGSLKCQQRAPNCR